VASEGGSRFVGSYYYRVDEGTSNRVAFVWDEASGTRYLRSVSGKFMNSAAIGASRIGSVVGYSARNDGTVVPTLWRCAWRQADPALPTDDINAEH
jgi:uncharacterized membrane protein